MNARPLRRLRVRGHVPAVTGKARPPSPAPRQGDAALLIHVVAEERDRVVLATAREVMLTDHGAVTTRERLFAALDRLDDLREQVAGVYPDVPPGLGVEPLRVDEIDVLGRLLANRGYRQRWPLVGFDLPWVVGRLTASAGHRGDRFSLSLLGCGAVGAAGQWVHSWHRPRLTVVPLGSGMAGAFLGWTHPKDPEDRYRGRRRATFVDLELLAGALSGGAGGDAAEAAGIFGVPWPTEMANALTRPRGEAKALVELYGRLVWALADVAPGLHPRDCWSFGSIATHLLRDAGVRAPLDKVGDLTDRDLGAAASACFGGRFSAAAVGISMPLVLRDVRSTYASVASLLDIGRVYSCRSFRCMEQAELRGLLANVAADGDRMCNPETWHRQGLTFVTLRPHGEALPCSVELRQGEWRTLVAPLDLAGGEATFHWCDVAGAIAEGADPAALDIVRVFELRPVGRQLGLGRLRLPTGREIDLGTEDLGAVLVAERRRVKTEGPAWRDGLAKSVGNALCYGNLARHDAKAAGRRESTAVGPAGERLAAYTRRAEQPGPHAFLPAAAAVCAGARLVLALVRRDVVGAGSEVVAMHADSIAVPGSGGGGWVDCPGAPDGKLRVLSGVELDRILDRLRPLGVTFRAEVGGAGDPTVGLAVGVNRIIFARPAPASSGGWEICRSSDTALGGHLADPSDHSSADRFRADGRWSWAAECEAVALAAVLASDVDPDRSLTALVDPRNYPSWTSRPVVRRYTVATWEALQHLRDQTGDPSVMPFARYLRAESSGRTSGPVALGPWWEAGTWPEADWRRSGQPVALVTIEEAGALRVVAGRGPRQVHVRTVRDHLTAWLQPEDASMTGPIRGLRRPVEVRSAPGLVVVTGKDGAELMASDEDPALVDPAGMRLDYGLAAGDRLRQRARTAGVRKLSRRCGVPYVTVRDWSAGGGTSHEVLARVVAALAEVEAEPTPPATLCGRSGCDRPARGRRWCSDRCRMAASRAAGPAASPRRLERIGARDGHLIDGMPSCPGCRTRFVNRRASELHQCQGRSSQ